MRKRSKREVAAIKMKDKKILRTARKDLTKLKEAEVDTRKIIREAKEEKTEIAKMKKERC